MKYLVDTDRVVDWLKGRADARRLLAALGNEGFAIIQDDTEDKRAVCVGGSAAGDGAMLPRGSIPICGK